MPWRLVLETHMVRDGIQVHIACVRSVPKHIVRGNRRRTPLLAAKDEVDPLVQVLLHIP
jgi:hypothetical protein